MGELTSELAPGDTIKEFVSVAPKAYAYQTVGGQGVCKFKGLLTLVCKSSGKKLIIFYYVVSFFSTGIRANYTTQGLINMEALLAMVEDEEYTTTVPTPMIVRNRETFELRTDLLREKRARLRFDKRVRYGNLSVPFGYNPQTTIIES